MSRIKPERQAFTPERQAFTVGKPERQAFTRGYIATMIWANTVTWDETGTPHEAPAHVTPSKACKRQAEADCRTFLGTVGKVLAALVEANTDRWEEAGHYLALTRNGHGAGYWEWSRLAGHYLAAQAHAMGEVTWVTYAPKTKAWPL